MRVALSVLGLAFLAAAAPDPAEDWSTTDLGWLGKDAATAFKESRAICAQVIRAEPPQTDRPTPAQAKTLKGCDSEALYYGIGRPLDPVKARLCAFTEKEDEIGPFGGRAMLMTIYANGAGVSRDLRIATHLACGVQGAPAEISGRVTHLWSLKPGEKFDLCDDITSGYMMGHCTALGERMEAPGREAELASLARAGGFAGARDWRALRKTLEAYAEAHGDGDVDQTGTARGMMIISAESGVRNMFLVTMKALVSGKVPAAGPAAFAKADAELNRSYRAALKELDPKPYVGQITRDGMRASALAWIAYRDAMLAFAARRFPAVPRTALATLLTQQRTDDLISDY